MTASESELKAAVKQKYGQAALRVTEVAVAGDCCGSSACCGATTETWDPITSQLYDENQKAGLPAEALLASLGCGNPTAVADLHEGESVLDLGSGGGIDVLLSAHRVGPMGKAYGVDMTDEMLELARRNQREAGVENVEFLKGTIEEVPLPDDSVDVIISNCVINLSGDKAAVFREAARVLRPGGRFAVTDIVADAGMDEETRADLAKWAGCLGGALTRDEFEAGLETAGFSDVEIRETHRVHDQAGSAIIRARMPA